MRVCYLICSIFLLFSCENNQRSLLIAGDIEDPKNEIIQTISELVTTKSDAITLKLKSGNLPSLDSLENDSYQLMIVDNNMKYREEVTAIVPLYSQILHILHRKEETPQNFEELVSGKKVYAGSINSGSYSILQDLISDFNIDQKNVQFVDVINLFEADVIILFTDLISSEELIDLQDFKFYSLDAPEKLGVGSIADAICLRYPQYEPYLLPTNVYGNFTKEPVLTISNEAVLVCRKDLSKEVVHSIAKLIHENKQAFNDISPLLHQGISENYNVQNLAFSLHPGARDYLERYEPSIFERNSNLIGVALTILIAFISGTYTLYNYRKHKKKDKIDVYYQKLIVLRLEIAQIENQTAIEKILDDVRAMQNETVGLVVQEKLSANDSFLVFLKLSELVLKEGQERRTKLI